MAEAVRHDKTARQLRLLSDALDTGRLGPVRRLVNTLSPAEIGNLLESLPPSKRNVVWGLVDPEDDGEVLVHVGEDVRESLLEQMDPDEIVAAAETLDLDDLAELIEDLPDTVIDEVLKAMDRENRERLEQALSYPYDTAAFGGAVTKSTKASAAGFNAGIDVTWLFAESVGIGGIVRYTRADVDLAAVEGRSITMKAGGLQGGVGIRVLF